MAHIDFDLEDLGRNIQDIVDRAVNSRDYQKLDQTLRQAVGKVADVGSGAVRKVVESTRTTGSPRKSPPPCPERDLSLFYGKTNRITAGGILKIVGGSMLSAFGLLVFLFGLVLEMASGAVAMIFPLLSTCACLMGGGALIGSGTGSIQLVGRFKSYRKQLGQKTVCSLENLARSVGKSEKFVFSR